MTLSEALLQSGIDDGIFTHATYAAMRGGRLIGRKAFGAATLETVFDLASLTKPMATATGILQCAERGMLHLRQSLASFFEDEFGPLPHFTDVQLRHLLTHTSGLPPLPLWPTDGARVSRHDLMRYVLSTPTLRPPGAGYTYSDTGYILLGEVLIKVTGKPLDVYFQEEISAPLGLHHTRFLPVDTAKVAPTGPELPGAVHDPRARDLGGVAGHAGLFGIVGDVLAYGESIRTGGRPVLSPASAARMALSQIAPDIGAQSYGWFCPGNDYHPQGDLFSDHSFGHSGFTGTLLLIDPAFNVTLVLLTNRVVNQTEDSSRFLQLRRRWLNTVASALS